MARCNHVRTDTNRVLGVHGTKYKAIKHDDVVNSVFEAVALHQAYPMTTTTRSMSLTMAQRCAASSGSMILSLSHQMATSLHFQLTFFNPHTMRSWAFRQSAEGLRLDCSQWYGQSTLCCQRHGKDTRPTSLRQAQASYRPRLMDSSKPKNQYISWKKTYMSAIRWQRISSSTKSRRINNNTSTFSNGMRSGFTTSMVCWRNDKSGIGAKQMGVIQCLDLLVITHRG